jgi:mannose-1-phosphate guanylyltransferase / mannose-6-phosphate isomerase
MVGAENSAVYPVILSGGAGTRLWPLSRDVFPKQLQPLLSNRSMLQKTLERVSDMEIFSAPFVICNAQHSFVVDEQVRAMGIDDHRIITEPMGRNTAPAAAIAALSVDPDDIVVILPSDHDIGKPDAFAEAMGIAIGAAREGRLATLGILPSAPETGFGYIRRGAETGEGSFAVDAFIEKPLPEAAAKYVAEGGHYWNAGIFAFRAGVFLAEMERWAPAMLAQTRAAFDAAQREPGLLQLGAAEFQSIAGNSIDYAVMERTDKAVVVPVDMDWSDLGSWAALWERGARDSQGNVLIGDAMAEDCENSYLRGEHGLIAGLGLRDMIVVGTADAILVAPKSRSQDVKRVVDRLNAAKRPQTIDSFKVYRPWGWFQTIELGDRFKVKHIMVKPGCKLSLQRHYHRSEHWIVVAGVGIVTCGDKSVVLNENQSTYIPIGEVHRLENPGRIPLNLIEVQSGEYVGEDDIVRLEDAYGRLSAD